MTWVASVQYPGAYGSATSGGTFDVTFSGGVPDGIFQYVADASGDSTDASADLIFTALGNVGGSAELPTLVASEATVTGSVTATELPGPTPVSFTLGAGDMTPIPLDVRQAGCSFVSGDLEAQIAQQSGLVESGGGSLDVDRAFWSAVRTGSAGATTPEQIALLNELVNDGTAIGVQLDNQVFDPAALDDLIDRAASFAASIKRNSDCGIGDAAHFSSAVADVVADLLRKMIANDDWLTAEQYNRAIIAGVAAGVLGANANAEGQQLTSQLLDILLYKLEDAVAAGDRDTMLTIAFAASTLGNDALSAQALAAWEDQ